MIQQQEEPKTWYYLKDVADCELAHDTLIQLPDQIWYMTGQYFKLTPYQHDILELNDIKTQYIDNRLMKVILS